MKIESVIVALAISFCTIMPFDFNSIPVPVYQQKKHDNKHINNRIDFKKSVRYNVPKYEPKKYNHIKFGNKRFNNSRS